MHIRVELYNCYVAADKIAYKMMIGSQITEVDKNAYRKAHDLWFQTFPGNDGEPDPGLPNRCREEGVNG